MATSYAVLKQDLQDWTENDAAEFVSELDTIMRLGQLRCERDMDIIGFKKVQTSAFTVGDPLVTVPGSPRAVIILNFQYVDGSDRVLMIPKTDEFITDYWPDRNVQGKPKYYGWLDKSLLIVAPAPDSAYALEMSFVQRLPVLSSGTTTNALTDEAEDALLYACLIEAYLFMKKPEASAVLNTRYEAAVQQIREEARRQRQDDLKEFGLVVTENNLVFRTGLPTTQRR